MKIMVEHIQHVKLGYEENWFKRHPGWTVFLVLILLSIIGSMFGGVKEGLEKGLKEGVTSSATQTNISESGEVVAEQPTEKPIQTFQIGQAVLLDDIAYRVNKVSPALEVGEYYGYGEYETFMGEKANGIFYIIDLTIENKGKQSENLFASTVTIIDNQEREFDYDTSAEVYYNGDKKAISFGEQLQPGLPISGVKIFDLPKTASGLKLKIKGSGLSTAVAYVDLGI
jgi:hypothetical protein